MGTELKKVITIDVSKSDKSVKDLRKRINELRDTLLNLDKTSDEYKNSVDEIVSIQNELNSVMSAGKQQLDASEGSYNQLVATMAELKKEWKATNDEARRAELGKQINGINNELKDLDASIGNAQRNVGNYNEGVKEGINLFVQQKELIKQLKNELLGLEEGTEEYNVKLGELADAQFKLKDMNELASRSANDLGEKIATCTRIASGMASGFGAVKGAMAAFGIESENLDKTMVQLQGVIAMVQGLQGLEGLTKDFSILKIQFAENIKGVKGFISGLSGVKKAIMATGIGLLVVALGTLIAYWQDIVKWLGLANDEKERAQKAAAGLSKEYDKLNAELDHNINLQKADGKTTKEVLEYKKKSIDEQIANEERKIREYETLSKREQKLYKESKETIEKNLEDLKKKQAAVNNEIEVEERRLQALKRDEDKKTKDEKIKNLQEIRKAELELIKDREEEIRKDNLTELQLLEDKYKKDLALYQKYGKDTSNLTAQFEKEYNEIKLKADEDATNQLYKRADEKYNALLKKIDDVLNISDENIDDIEFNASLEDSGTIEQAAQKQIDINNAIYNEKLIAYEQEKALLEKALEDEELSAAQKLEIRENLARREKEIEKEGLKVKQANAKNEEVIEKNKRKVKQDTVSMMGNLMGTMSQLLGEDTAAGKAAAIANTTISTWQTAQEAYAAAFNPGGIHSPALGALMMAQAIATGLINLKNIMSVNTSTASTGLLSSAGISSSAGAYPSNAVISDNLKMDNVRNILGDEEIENLNNSIKVYVVEEDITDTQKKVSVTEQNATF